jgi:hypothetical protein
VGVLVIVAVALVATLVAIPVHEVRFVDISTT